MASRNINYRYMGNTDTRNRTTGEKSGIGAGIAVKSSLRLCLPLRLCALRLCALLMVAAGPLAAQPFSRTINPFIVREASGERLMNPFTGGLDLTRIGLLDVDGDGRPDLFTLNLGEQLRLYHNEGTFPFQLDSTGFWENVPARSWFRFADIDGDGDPDFFTSGEHSEVMIARNNGSPFSPQFAPLDTFRQGGGEVVYTEQQTVPTFVDIDSDGDPDLFSGNIDGSITYYENTGTAQAPDFRFRTARFEGIIVQSPARTEEEKKPEVQRTALHGASVMDFVDLDNDDDLDMLFGDFFTKRLLHFENRGTRFRPDFDTLWIDTAFAPNGDRVESRGFNQAVTGYLDNDNDYDVIVSSLLASAGDRPIELFVNEGTPDLPLMRRSAVNLTSEIDVGRQAAPALLRDTERYGLLIGSEDGSLTWYEISEDEGKTSWRLKRRYFLSGVTMSAPATGDLDGDGRAEIVVGKSEAIDTTTLRLYRFEGDELVRVPWQLDTAGNVARRNASPALVDIDGDNDLDLFVGAASGRLYLFENIGTPTEPLFRGGPAPPPFSELDLDQDSAPRFGDLDNDGDPDVMIGSRVTEGTGYDTLRFWLNDGGTFRPDPDWPPMPVAYSPVPMLADFPEGRFLFLGAKAGGLLAFRDTTILTSVNEPAEARSSAAWADAALHGANDADRLLVRWSGMEGSGMERRLVVVDLAGRPVLQEPLEGKNGMKEVSLDGVPSGTYFWRVAGVGEGRFVVKR